MEQTCTCHVDKIQSAPASATSGTQAVALRLEGLGCQNCANRVHNALASTPGVTFVHVDLPSGTATVHIDQDQVRALELPDIVRAAGWSSGHHYDAMVIDTA
ncbi:MAG TPA: heavy-metal-associated domain-containing protein [Gemmatimonadaceae bacterium]|jgi:copper chaperone CopZ